MGYEYQLDFDVTEPSEVDAVLRTIPGFEQFSPHFALYSFRRTATGSMPDADAKIEPSGVYVCDHGGAHAILTDIQAALAARGYRVTLREL
jgi:hypothetical protein